MASDVMEDAGERKRAEQAHLLRRAQHPGVAAFVEDDELEPATGITLGRHDGRRLGETELTVEEIAGVFAVLATTVADLNELGVQIGVMTGDGVRLGPDGRPMIVDLSAATIIDPPPKRGKTPNTDVRSVGALLTQTLRRCTPDVLTEVPATRHWPRRRAPTLGQHVAALATTADRGAIPLRQLAEGLVHPDARLPRPMATPGAAVPRGTAITSEDGRPYAIAGVDAVDGVGRVDAVDGVGRVDGVAGVGRIKAVAAVAGAGRTTVEPPGGSRFSRPPGVRVRHRVGRLLVRGRPELARLALRQAGAGRWVRRGVIGTLAVAGGVLITLGVAAIPGPPRPHSRLTPARPGMPGGTSVCLAVNASGSCTAPATYAGGVLSTPTGRFAVGRPDDVVAAGRWSCGPVATLAVLRPDRGEVWAFPGWPAGGSVLTARLVARVAQARRLTAQTEGACDALVVTRADGTSVVVDRRMFT